MQKTLASVLLAALAFPVAADARPRLTEQRATIEARQIIEAEIAYSQEDNEADNPPFASYELDPCESLSQRRAECDATLYLTTGAACDALVEVVMTRRGRVAAEITTTVCD